MFFATLKSVIAAAFLTLMLSVPTIAASPQELEAEGVRIWKMLPRPSEMIRHPGPEAWVLYGTKAKGKITSSDGVPGGDALRINIKKAGDNAWDIGANANSQLPVNQGDVILGSFWARAKQTPDGTAQTIVPFALQQSSEPYTQFAMSNAVVTANWSQYFIHATMPQAYKKGMMGVAVQLAGAAHEIELGPVYIMNMGAGPVDNALMPKSMSIKSDTMTVPSPAITAPAAVTQQAAAIVPVALQSDFAKLRATLPSQGQLLASPQITAAAVFGSNERHNIVGDNGVPGGEALEITVTQAGLNSWSTGVNWATTGDISKDDVVFLAYWAKGLDAKNEAQTPIISPARVQQSAEPYNSALTGVAYLSRDWQLYYASGKSAYDIAAGASGISFHLGLTPQTLRLGPAYLINLGPNADFNRLPRNRISYEGEAPNAPWRAVAAAKIEQHRKADMTITVVDSAGNPLANQAVNVTMTDHAFNFGSFVGHEFIKAEGAKNAKLHETFNASFNTATLPLYWQDWGWNGKFKANYKATVKYAHETGLPWRGHPIVWPGKAYMPSYILDTQGDRKKQRKQVLDHVSDVMGFIKDYDPIAVDMVNEVRVNQYFKEQGDDDLILDAFKLAHSIAPDIPLFVNDYAILNNGGFNQKAIDFYHDWIVDMRGRGAPLGGIGFQGHFGAGLTSPQRVMDILGSFAKYDLPLHITEFDIETFDEVTQAAYTRDMLTAAFSEPKMEAFIVWGWWEGDHWKAPAAMLRTDWSEKPNYKAWRDLIYKDWWTDETVTTDANGTARLRGFKGDYTVTVGGATQNVTLDTPQTITVVTS